MFHVQIKSRDDEDICLLVRADNHPWNYLCDCGDASGLTVRECQDTAAIFISHTHFDHFVNFDWIVRHQIGAGREVVICGPADIARQVQARLRSYTWNLIDPEAITYQIREIRVGASIRQFRLRPPLWELEALGTLKNGPVFSTADFTVDYTILDHKIPSIAYRFRERDTVKIDMSRSRFPGGPWVQSLKSAFHAGDETRIITVDGIDLRAGDLFELLFVKPGDTLGVIMDHAADVANHQAIRELFSNCRQVCIECFYLTADRDLADLHHHSYAEASGRIMRDCQVPDAFPIHFSRKYDTGQIEQIRAEFREAYRQ